MTEADGIGPSYCKSCIKRHGKRCPDCPRPEILPENLPVVKAFGVVSTQMRYRPNGLRSGLDYQAARAAWRFHEIGVDAEIFAGVQVIESELITIDLEAMEKHGNKE